MFVWVMFLRVSKFERNWNVKSERQLAMEEVWPGIILVVCVATTLLPFEYRWKAISYLTVFRHLWHNLLWRRLVEGCRKLMLGAFVLCHVSRAGLNPRGLFERYFARLFICTVTYFCVWVWLFIAHYRWRVWFKSELLFPLSLSLSL